MPGARVRLTGRFAPALFKNLPCDPFKDFAPVSVVTQLPLVLVTSESSKANTNGRLL
jgi:tripartite-type tricarboxylate transporter receptor subunit TctC